MFDALGAADPWASALGGLGSALGSTAPAQSGASTWIRQDGSGWTVSTGRASATGATLPGDPSQASAPTVAGFGGPMGVLALVLFVGLVAWKSARP